MFGIGRGRGRGNLGRRTAQDGDRASPFTTTQGTGVALVQPFDKTSAAEPRVGATPPQTHEQFRDNEVTCEKRDQLTTPKHDGTGLNNGDDIHSSQQQYSPAASAHNRSQVHSIFPTGLKSPPGLGRFSPSLEFKPPPGFQLSSLMNPQAFQAHIINNLTPQEGISPDSERSKFQGVQQPAKPIPHLFSPDEFTIKGFDNISTSKESCESKEQFHKENEESQNNPDEQKKGVYVPPQLRKMMEEEKEACKRGQTVTHPKTNDNLSSWSTEQYQHQFQSHPISPRDEVGQKFWKGAHHNQYQPYQKVSQHPPTSNHKDTSFEIPLSKIVKQQHDIARTVLGDGFTQKLTLPLGRGRTSPEKQSSQREQLIYYQMQQEQKQQKLKVDSKQREKAEAGSVKHLQQKKPLQWRKDQQENQQVGQSLQQSSTGHHYSQKPLQSQEKVIKAELEWKKWKLQRTVKRLFNKTYPDDMDSIPEELENCLLKSKLSRDFPGLSDVQVLIEVVFDHILEKPSSRSVGVEILKALYDLETESFNTHFLTIFRTHRDELQQDHGVSDIFARVKGFCFFGGLLFIVARTESLGFKETVTNLVKESLAKWLTMLTVVTLTNPIQIKVVAESVYYLLRVVGKDLQEMDSNMVQQFVDSARNCVLSDNLPRSSRGVILDLLLVHAADWPEIDTEAENDDEDDVIIEDDSVAESTSQDGSYNDQDPYCQVRKMLSELNLQDMLNRFEVNCIRDSILSADKDDLKSTFQEAGFPPGVVLEMQMYLSKQKLNSQSHPQKPIHHSSGGETHPSNGTRHTTAQLQSVGQQQVESNSCELDHHKNHYKLNALSPPFAQNSSNENKAEHSKHPSHADLSSDSDNEVSKTDNTKSSEETVLPWRQRPQLETTGYKPPEDHFPSLSEASKTPGRKEPSFTLSENTPSEFSSEQGGWSSDSEGSEPDIYIDPKIYYPPPPPPETVPFGSNKPICCSCGSTEHRTWECKNRVNDFGF